MRSYWRELLQRRVGEMKAALEARSAFLREEEFRRSSSHFFFCTPLLDDKLREQRSTFSESWID
jgi:hypothetical protein